MNQFAVVTDSAADIPLDLAQRYGIRVVPLHCVFEGKDYRDGIDISTPELLRLMDGADTLPVTSQPTPADFMVVYQELIDEGYTQILSIHLARALSATIESARALASQMPEGVRLEVVDSCSATVAQGTMALEAAVIAQNGGTIEQALERVRAIQDGYHIYFSPNTLDNLVKGGRATKAQGFATALLNIKLVIGLLRDGSIEVEHKAKGVKGAISYMVKQVAADAAEHGELVYYALHTNAADRAAKIRESLEKTGAHVRWLTDATIGPVIATHVGNGAMGIFTFPAALHSPELDDLADYLTPQF